MLASSGADRDMWAASSLHALEFFETLYSSTLSLAWVIFLSVDFFFSLPLFIASYGIHLFLIFLLNLLVTLRQLRDYCFTQSQLRNSSPWIWRMYGRFSAQLYQALLSFFISFFFRYSCPMKSDSSSRNDQHRYCWIFLLFLGIYMSFSLFFIFVFMKKTIRVWDLRMSQCTQTIAHSHASLNSEVLDVAYHPKQDILFSVSSIACPYTVIFSRTYVITILFLSLPRTHPYFLNWFVHLHRKNCFFFLMLLCLPTHYWHLY